MTAPPDWRRIADWKHTVVLVEHAELPEGSAAGRDWAVLREHLREHAPSLAEAVERFGFVRVGTDAVADLHSAGIHTVEVGYRSGVDVLSYVEAGPIRQGEAHLDAIGIAVAVDEEEAPVDDVIDALLRIHSEGVLTEAAVLLAVALPRLGRLGRGGEAPVDFGKLDPSLLPEVTASFVDRVASALTDERSRPPTGVWPDLTVAQRRTYQKQGAVMVLLGLIVMGLGATWMPVLLAVGAPILVLGTTVVALHEAVLRQQQRS